LVEFLVSAVAPAKAYETPTAAFAAREHVMANWPHSAVDKIGYLRLTGLITGRMRIGIIRI